MSQLHKALEHLHPRDFNEVPLDKLNDFLSDLFSNAELIANSVPPPPNGSPYESSRRSRTDVNGATSAADLTISDARRPPPCAEHAELRKQWGKPLKLWGKDQALGISVYKMAGHDRHGAWFARTSVHEGLGFTKWKQAMMREFPESLAVQGGPGEGNVRGIGGDQRLEDINVPGVGKLEVYQLSAQFPGPTSPREFITLLLTSENCLSDASKVGNKIPRHYMIVSIPVSHPRAPPRNGLIRGTYESVEMIREIPLAPSKPASASTSDLHKHSEYHTRERGSTIGFAESRGPEAKGEETDRKVVDNAETNPVEWIMITRSDPGGGIPRFMVERNTPSSIVQDAGKFLDWACARSDILGEEAREQTQNADGAKEQSERKSVETERRFSISGSNGILAGVGTSIADDPHPLSFRRPSQNQVDKGEGEHENTGIINSVANTIESYIPASMNPLKRSTSQSTSSTATSADSFASAEQFNTAPEGLPVDRSILTPSSDSTKSASIAPSELGIHSQDNRASKEMQKIEAKRQELKEKLDQAREKAASETQEASTKSARELEKATEKHNRERKKQEDKLAKELQKLEARRERETKKLLARQQKEADKNNLLKTQRERDEWKEKWELLEQENKLLKEQIGNLQRENTAIVAKLGKIDGGLDILKKVKEEIEGKGRHRASSTASFDSRRSDSSGKRGNTGNGSRGRHEHEHSSLSKENT